MATESYNGMVVRYEDSDYTIHKYDFDAMKKRDEEAVALAIADERKKHDANNNGGSGHEGEVPARMAVRSNGTA